MGVKCSTGVMVVMVMEVNVVLQELVMTANAKGGWRLNVEVKWSVGIDSGDDNGDGGGDSGCGGVGGGGEDGGGHGGGGGAEGIIITLANPLNYCH